MDGHDNLSNQGRQLLRFLSGGPASVRPSSQAGKIAVEADGRGAILVEGGLLALLASKGVLARTTHSIALSGQGAALARRLTSPDALQDRHRDLDVVAVTTQGGDEIVLANLAESPLAQLVRRKGRDGKPFLSEAEYQAGERLRADYTRGQIMPRLGANWVASVSSGRRASGGGVADLTDAALGARQRVDNAVAAVGPELSGVLIDVCCFLKGLERVETERGWPVRSAKIVLKTALGVLAATISPPRTPARRDRHALHWGTDDYRPTICLTRSGVLLERRLGIALDALDHRAQAVGALAATDARRGRASRSVASASVCDDLAGRPSGKQRQHDRDQAAHDMGVRIALEGDDRIGARSACRWSARPG